MRKSVRIFLEICLLICDISYLKRSFNVHLCWWHPLEVWCMTTINFDTFSTAAVAGAAKSDSSTEVKIWAEYENMKKLAESQSHSRLWQELLWLSCATTLLKIFTFDHTTLHYNMMNASHAVHVTQTTNKQAMQFKFNRLREGVSMSSLCWPCDLYVRWLFPGFQCTQSHFQLKTSS